MAMTDTIRISKAFATPLVIHRIPNPAALNEDLKNLVLAAELQSPSTRHSNIGGWRSSNQLLDSNDSAFTALREHIQNAVLQLIKATAGEMGFTGYLKINGWANVLRRGNYNTLHNHPDSSWSGVYYVDSGSVTTDDSLSGILELIDPRPHVEMVTTPGNPFGMPLRIQPEAGLMILFPSWLNHHVHPYTGDDARISIAFNVPTAGTSSQ